MKTMNYTERNKQVKKAVRKTFPNDKVSVTGGRGTATGWVDVKLTLKCDKDCDCNWVEKTSTWAKEPYTYLIREARKEKTENLYDDRYMYMCPSCSKKAEEAMKKLKEVVYNCGAKFSQYTVDDGYNTQSAECLTSVEIVK